MNDTHINITHTHTHIDISICERRHTVGMMRTDRGIDITTRKFFFKKKAAIVDIREMQKKWVNNKRWIVNVEKEIKEQSWSNRGV